MLTPLCVFRTLVTLGILPLDTEAPRAACCRTQTTSSLLPHGCIFDSNFHFCIPECRALFSSFTRPALTYQVRHLHPLAGALCCFNRVSHYRWGAFPDMIGWTVPVRALTPCLSPLFSLKWYLVILWKLIYVDTVNFLLPPSTFPRALQPVSLQLQGFFVINNPQIQLVPMYALGCAAVQVDMCIFLSNSLFHAYFSNLPLPL